MRSFAFRITHLALIVGVLALPACGASARQTAIRATLVTVDAARDGFLAYDAQAQGAIVAASTSADDAKAKLGAYRSARDAAVGPGGLITAAYHAIAAAAAVNTDQSLASMEAAAAQLELALKPYLLGGGK